MWFKVRSSGASVHFNKFHRLVLNERKPVCSLRFRLSMRFMFLSVIWEACCVVSKGKRTCWCQEGLWAIEWKLGVALHNFTTRFNMSRARDRLAYQILLLCCIVIFLKQRNSFDLFISFRNFSVGHEAKRAIKWTQECRNDFYVFLFESHFLGVSR